MIIIMKAADDIMFSQTVIQSHGMIQKRGTL